MSTWRTKTPTGSPWRGWGQRINVTRGSIFMSSVWAWFKDKKLQARLKISDWCTEKKESRQQNGQTDTEADLTQYQYAPKSLDPKTWKQPKKNTILYAHYLNTDKVRGLSQNCQTLKFQTASLSRSLHSHTHTANQKYNTSLYITTIYMFTIM